MRLATLADGRAVRVEGDALLPLPGRLADHLCRPPAEPTGATIDASTATLAPPIARPGKLACIGLNYRDHAAEQKKPLPAQPLLFIKPSTCVIGPGASIVLPPDAGRIDHEAEAGVVIGRRASRVSEADAHNYIFGITCVNDVTARQLQEKGVGYTWAKGYDTFAPIGPCIVQGLDYAAKEGITVEGIVNGTTRQSSSTRELIFPIPMLVAVISSIMTLLPGDIISTGTPSGVGSTREPRVWLKSGDEIVISSPTLGELRTTIA